MRKSHFALMVVAGVCLGGTALAAPSKAVLEKGIRASHVAMNGTRAAFTSVKVLKTGPVENKSQAQCIPVQVQVTYTATDNPPPPRGHADKTCSGVGDWGMCRKKDPYGKYGPWRVSIIDFYNNCGRLR